VKRARAIEEDGAEDMADRKRNKKKAKKYDDFFGEQGGAVQADEEMEDV
jgi:hypothetical protein